MDMCEYYGGTYPSPPEDDEEEKEEFDYDDYIDYCYESYRDNLLTEEIDNEIRNSSNMWIY